MSISLLPQELVRLVMEDLDSERATLRALTSTCKHVNFEATRILYRSMTDLNGTTNYKFLLKIRKYRHLAQLVHIYHSPGTTNTQRGSLWSLIRRCLPLMVNLKELDLLNIPGNPLKLLPSLPKGQILPFQLQKLYISGSGHEQEVAQLLETQYELKHLHLSSSRGLNLSHNACPNLRTLRVHVEFARNILRGRQITELDLRIRNYSSFFAHDLEEILQSLSQLEVTHVFYLSLDNSFSPWWDQLDARRIKPFPNVEILQISDIYDVSQIASDVARFPRLRRLVVTVPQKWHDEIRAGVSLFFAKQPNLKYVDIFWDKPALYQRWVDGVPQPSLVHVHSLQFWNLAQSRD